MKGSRFNNRMQRGNNNRGGRDQEVMWRQRQQEQLRWEQELRMREEELRRWEEEEYLRRIDEDRLVLFNMKLRISCVSGVPEISDDFSNILYVKPQLMMKP